MEVPRALRRLGYIDRPAVGDHIRFFKKLDHPEGAVTIQVGMDSDHLGHRDVARIRDRTKLADDDLWERALRRKLPQDEYDGHLAAFPKHELVIEFWRHKLKGDQ